MSIHEARHLGEEGICGDMDDGVEKALEQDANENGQGVPTTDRHEWKHEPPTWL